MKNILYVCIHNSARSQMAQAYTNHFFGDVIHAESAGLESGTLNPLVVKVMQEDGIDIANNSPKTIDEFLLSKPRIDVVITVCDEASAERCPYIPGIYERRHWSFPDPSEIEGTEEFKLEQTRNIRDLIRQKVRLELPL